MRGHHQSYHYSKSRWRIPAPRQARKMFGVAVMGWVFSGAMFAYDLVERGSVDLVPFLAFGGLFTFAAALSWGLSALTAISLRKLRPQAPKLKRMSAEPLRSRPWVSRSGRQPGQVRSLGLRLRILARLQMQRDKMPSAGLAGTALAIGAAIGGLAFVIHPHLTPNANTVAASANFQLCGSLNGRNCVIDGDTIYHNGVKIRLADIDTPETFSPKCTSELELGRKAKYRLHELMNAGPFEVTYNGSRDEDVYGRKLRIIKRNGRSVGDTLIAEGLARRWDGARRSWCG